MKVNKTNGNVSLLKRANFLEREAESCAEYYIKYRGLYNKTRNTDDYTKEIESPKKAGKYYQEAGDAYSELQGQEEKTAYCYSKILDLCITHKDIKEEEWKVFCIEKAIKYYESQKNDIKVAEICSRLAVLMHEHSDMRAIIHYKKAIESYKNLKKNEDSLKCIEDLISLYLCRYNLLKKESKKEALTQCCKDAIKYCKEKIVFYQELPSTHKSYYKKSNEIIDCYEDMSQFYIGLNDREKVAEFHVKCDDFADSARFYKKAADNYEKIKDSSKANKFYKKASEYYQKHGEKLAGYNGYSSFKIAIKYFKKATKLNNELDNRKEIAEWYLKMGGSQKNKKEKTEYYDKALDLYEELGDENKKTEIYLNKASSCKDIADSYRARRFEFKKQKEEAELYLESGELFLKAKKIDDAIDCFKSGIKFYVRKIHRYERRKENIEKLEKKLAVSEAEIYEKLCKFYELGIDERIANVLFDDQKSAEYYKKLGDIYKESYDAEKAIIFHEKLKNFYQELKDKEFLNEFECSNGEDIEYCESIFSYYKSRKKMQELKEMVDKYQQKIKQLEEGSNDMVADIIDANLVSSDNQEIEQQIILGDNYVSDDINDVA